MTAVTSLVLGLGLTTTACYIFLAILVGPALEKAGLNKMAVHMFVFYWGMLSAITPPVAVANFAAAAISGANPMALGPYACKLTVGGFMAPFFFLFNPGLLMEGPIEQILSDFGGEVPGDMDSLVRLRGVGRKTASIVLGNAFGVPAVAVDRHVERVATRLGFTRKGADGIEQELRSLYPKKDWVKATWNFVLHGRRICTPTPKCPICPIIELCPYPKKTKAVSTTRRTSPPRSVARQKR